MSLRQLCEEGLLLNEVVEDEGSVEGSLVLALATKLVDEGAQDELLLLDDLGG